MRKKSHIFHRGYSLVEILVVITIFAILAVLVSGLILYSLRSSRKSESLSRVRSELDNVISLMERQLRNSEYIDCPIPGQIRYLDPNNPAVYGYFECIIPEDADSYIASRSAFINGDPAYGNFRLTGDDIKINSCTFACGGGGVNTPTTIDVKFVAETVTTGIDSSGEVPIETLLILRNY